MPNRFDSWYSRPFWKTKHLQTRLHPSSSQSGCHTAFWLKVRATPLEMKYLHLWSSPLEMKNVCISEAVLSRWNICTSETLNLDTKTTFFVCVFKKHLSTLMPNHCFFPLFLKMQHLQTRLHSFAPRSTTRSTSVYVFLLHNVLSHPLPP